MFGVARKQGDIEGEKRKTVTTIRAESVHVCGAGGGEGWKKWESKTIFGGRINRQYNYKNIREEHQGDRSVSLSDSRLLIK